MAPVPISCVPTRTTTLPVTSNSASDVESCSVVVHQPSDSPLPRSGPAGLRQSIACGGAFDGLAQPDAGHDLTVGRLVAFLQDVAQAKIERVHPDPGGDLVQVGLQGEDALRPARARGRRRSWSCA